MSVVAPFHQDEPELELKRNDQHSIATLIHSLLNEAELARKSGHSPRDDTWSANFELYWRKHDFSEKASWQAKHVMPEAPGFVDRWAAALREALTSGPRFYKISDPGDPDGDLTQHYYRLIDYLLDNCGRSPDGSTIDFGAVFEEQMKLAALSVACLSVTYNGEEQDDSGFVHVGTVDPREVFLDHTGDARWRLRVYEVETSDLEAMRDMVDLNEEPIYSLPADLTELVSRRIEGDTEREEAAGHGGDKSARRPVKITEFVGTLVSETGDVIGRNVLVVLANDTHVIRGPEENPFWHKRDWIVTTPIVVVPLSVYGKSYLEDWSSLAVAFTDLTNLLLDAATAESVKIFGLQPDALQDPSQVDDGVHGGKVFLLEEGSRVSDFLEAVEVGKLGRGPIQVWEALKQEIREGAKLNEIALGQLAPTERTATEIAQTSQSSSAILRSIARTVESRLIEPTLSRMVYTALQSLNFKRADVIDALGKETAAMFDAQAAEFAARNLKVKVDGISALIDRQTKLRNFLAMLQTLSQNELLLAAFLKQVSADRMLTLLVELFGVDMSQIQKTAQERTVESLTQPPAGPAPTGQSAGPPPPMDNPGGALG